VAQLVKGIRYKLKDRGSVFSGVIERFHLHNSFGRTMALGLTQSATEISTRNIS
jgi:hypothetical protein